MRYRKHNIPEINSSSTADIAFLLMIFFLIAGSLNSVTGIYRKMNPAQTEEILKKKRDIEERNLLNLTIDTQNQVVYKGEVIAFLQLKEICKTFIDNPNNVDFLPRKESVDIPGIGVYSTTSNHNIALEISREANYQTYLSVLNKIMTAYSELQNEASHTIFHQSFNQLTLEQREAIRQIYPVHISEKEPDSETKGGAQ
jgi:biopolymer transport protein ExbD